MAERTVECSAVSLAVPKAALSVGTKAGKWVELLAEKLAAPKVVSMAEQLVRMRVEKLENHLVE